MNFSEQTNNHTNIQPPALVNKDRTYLITIPYKGLDLTEMVRVFHIGQGYAVFQIPNPRMCAGLKDKVYLRNPESNNTIVARVGEVNIQRGWLTLCNFMPARSLWRERRSDRVQAGHPVQVRLQCQQHECQGTLDDLSIHGLGVLIYHTDGFKIPVNLGEKVHFEFRLPNDTKQIRMEGRLVCAQPVSKKLSRIGLHINPTRSQINTLNRFIQNRRMELLAELELLWMRTQEPRGSKDLYF